MVTSHSSNALNVDVIFQQRKHSVGYSVANFYTAEME
jgi:hypothetical protein